MASTLHPAPPERPELPDGVEPTPIGPRWKPTSVLLAFAIGIAITLVAGIVLTLVAVLFGADSSDLPTGVTILLTVAQDAAFIGAAIFVASTVMRPRPWHFGLRGTRVLPALGWTVLAYVALLLASALYVTLVGAESQDELPGLDVDGDVLALVAAAFLVTVVAPIAEEFFFRGFVFGALRNWKGIWVGAALTGVIFGAIHIGSTPDNLLLPILMLFGFILCLLYVKTGSLYPCMAFHAFNNALTFGNIKDAEPWGYALLLGGSLACIALFALVVRRVSGPVPAHLRSV